MAQYLGVPLTTVYRKSHLATEYVREKLKDVFPYFDELQPPQAPASPPASPATSGEPTTQPTSHTEG